MKKTKSFSAFPWLFKKTKRYLPGVLLLALLNAVLALSYIRLALLSEELIDAASVILKEPPSSDLLDCLTLPEIYLPAFHVMGIILLQVVLSILCTNVRVRVSGNVEIRIRQTVFSSLLNKEYEQFHRYHSGELLNRLTADIQHVVQGVSGLIPAAVSMATKLIGGLIVLTRISPWFTLGLSAVGAVVMLCSRFYGVRMKRLHKECQETDGKTRSFMQESFSNLLSVKAFSNEPYMEERLLQNQKANFRMQVKRNTMSNIGHTVVYLLLTGAYYLALIWGVLCLIAGTLTFGTLTALLQIFEQLKAPLRNASSLLPQYYAMMASAERLQELELLSGEAPKKGEEERRRLRDSFRSLKAEKVVFAYDKNAYVLDGVDLCINKGEIVTLIGESGIGKSTLMKLILAILYPESGELYADCGDERCPLDASARFLFSYVPQGNAVFAGTLRENIAFFRTGIADDDVLRALDLACLTELTESLPKGLDTLLGEHGFDLSEGQAQRVAIARALLNDAPVLLLDECTSALDGDTEERLLANIKRMTDKTVLMISHRNTAAEGSDRVFRIQDRKITEMDSVSVVIK